MIKAKDVLHLYLGVPCLMDDGKTGKMMGYAAKDLDGGMMIMYTIEYGRDDEDWAVYNDDEEMERIKPILRPLCSMTEEEAIELTKRAYWTRFHGSWVKYEARRQNGKIWVINSKNASERDIPQDGTQFTPEQFAYALKRGFDLFNLIPNGEAIDATSLSPQPISS